MGWTHTQVDLISVGGFHWRGWMKKDSTDVDHVSCRLVGTSTVEFDDNQTTNTCRTIPDQTIIFQDSRITMSRVGRQPEFIGIDLWRRREYMLCLIGRDPCEKNLMS